jgi:hypothetical protein
VIESSHETPKSKTSEKEKEKEKRINALPVFFLRETLK